MIQQGLGYKDVKSESGFILKVKVNLILKMKVDFILKHSGILTWAKSWHCSLKAKILEIGDKTIKHQLIPIFNSIMKIIAET